MGFIQSRENQVLTRPLRTGVGALSTPSLLAMARKAILAFVALVLLASSARAEGFDPLLGVRSADADNLDRQVDEYESLLSSERDRWLSLIKQSEFEGEEGLDPLASASRKKIEFYEKQLELSRFALAWNAELAAISEEMHEAQEAANETDEESPSSSENDEEEEVEEPDPNPLLMVEASISEALAAAQQQSEAAAERLPPSNFLPQKREKRGKKKASKEESGDETYNEPYYYDGEEDHYGWDTYSYYGDYQYENWDYDESDYHHHHDDYGDDEWDHYYYWDHGDHGDSWEEPGRKDFVGALARRFSGLDRERREDVLEDLADFLSD